MKLRIVSSKDEIGILSPNEKMVHLAFRASNVDLLNLIKRCPRLKAIQLPPSYYKTSSHAILVFMDTQGVELLAGDVWGHRKDLDEYFTVDSDTIKEIVALTRDGMPAEDIANQVKEMARLSPDLIRYIAKQKDN